MKWKLVSSVSGGVIPAPFSSRVIYRGGVVHIIYPLGSGLELKHCGRCNRWLPLAQFNLGVAKGDGLQSWCSICQADHRRAGRFHFCVSWFILGYTVLYGLGVWCGC